ncbi:MAG: twin-arginine translocase subunit TatC [Lentisphaeria bacterium]|nr:twin-arginine translocase subunit TatC [Lentisphaeria bacterium]
MNSTPGTSLLDHLDAFRSTLLWCLGAVVVMSVPGSIFTFPLLMRYVAFVCPPGVELHYFTPFEPLIVQLELGLLTGCVLSLPVILVKLWSFVAPGLYLHEKRWVLFFIISSLVLMSMGVALSLGAVVPIVMNFSGSFAADGLKPVIGLGAFLKMAAMLSAGFAIVFEIPVALLLAIRFGIVRVESLQKHRPLIVVILFVGAALLTPPDIISQLLMGLPGWILFELTLFIGAGIAPRQNREDETEEYPVVLSSAVTPETVLTEQDTTACRTSDSQLHYVDDITYRRAARKKRKIRHI